VLVYVLWPTPPPEPTPVVKKGPKDGPPVARVDPTVKDPVVRPKDPDQPVAVVPPVAAADDAGEQGTGTTPPPDETLDEVDAGVEAPPDENPNELLDDVRLGQLKRDKRIDISLDDMEATMKQEPDRRELFENAYKRVKKLCDGVRTLKDFYDCEDEVTKLRDRFYKI
jgi:hypothetical protein